MDIFSNYESPKADQFFQNCNISCLFFWEKINTQIRMKAKISKTNSKISDRHFSKEVSKKCVGHFIKTVKRN